MGDNYMIAVKEAIDLGLGAKPIEFSSTTHVLVFDVDSAIQREAIIVDKRYYEIRYIGETERTVEIQIGRKS